ncbi:MAG TPA: DUF3014 domain-containing protein [Pseudomonadales bacterium]
MQKAILAVVVVIALAVIGWVLWPADEPPPAPEPEPPAEPAPPPQPEPPSREPLEPGEPTAPPEPEVVLPPLQESDAFVRERLAPMDLPERWVEQGDYVRRLAVLAENASRGELPRRQLAFMAPRGEFKVVRRGERLFLDPASYDRYDRYVEELEQIDPAYAANLVKTLEPLVQDALVELGVQAPPGEVFEAAIREVLAVPVLPDDGSVELVQPNVMYEYANPELEALSPLKKQVLRMGPENVRRLQDYLRQVAAALNIDLAS